MIPEKPARFLFVAAAVFAVVMALLPSPPNVMPHVGDKVQHMTAFGVMTLLARLGWRQAGDWRILERLSFLGALIEVFQSIPMLHRDCDVRDWIADTIAVAAVLVLTQALKRKPASADRAADVAH